MLPSVRKLDLSLRSWVFQQDHDPKHTNPKNTQEWVRAKHWNILKWPSMSPDLNPIEHLWKELKHAVCKRHEEWTKIPVDRCGSLIDSYRNCLIASKGFGTKY